MDVTESKRHTEHATEKCVRVCGFACAAEAIPPKNERKVFSKSNHIGSSYR